MEPRPRSTASRLVAGLAVAVLSVGALSACSDDSSSDQRSAVERGEEALRKVDPTTRDSLVQSGKDAAQTEADALDVDRVVPAPAADHDGDLAARQVAALDPCTAVKVAGLKPSGLSDDPWSCSYGSLTSGPSGTLTLDTSFDADDRFLARQVTVGGVTAYLKGPATACTAVVIPTTFTRALEIRSDESSCADLSGAATRLARALELAPEKLRAPLSPSSTPVCALLADTPGARSGKQSVRATDTGVCVVSDVVSDEPQGTDQVAVRVSLPVLTAPEPGTTTGPVSESALNTTGTTIDGCAATSSGWKQPGARNETSVVVTLATTGTCAQADSLLNAFLEHADTTTQARPVRLQPDSPFWYPANTSDTAALGACRHVPDASTTQCAPARAVQVPTGADRRAALAGSSDAVCSATRAAVQQAHPTLTEVTTRRSDHGAVICVYGSRDHSSSLLVGFDGSGELLGSGAVDGDLRIDDSSSLLSLSLSDSATWSVQRGQEPGLVTVSPLVRTPGVTVWTRSWPPQRN